MNKPDTNNSHEPTLASIINIAESGVRSVNIERDLSNSKIADRYILSTQNRLYLDRLLNCLNGDASSRAWTLTGPYGSGKSFFSLFLMNLTCSIQPAHKSTHQKLADADPALAEKTAELLSLCQGHGLLPIAITGYRASITECLKHGLMQAIEALGQCEVLANLYKELASWSNQTDSRSITRWLEKLLDVLPELQFRGLIIIFDELGKPLEFAASHQVETDIYLLQELAELASRSDSIPFVFVGILHQSFERYAALLDMTTQQEWSKVQGRFEDIAFQQTPALQLRLVASAIEVNDLNYTNSVAPHIDVAANEALRVGWCPPLMGEEEFLELCHQCYPLHPSTMVTLPFLFRRLAQNERSLFAYLASGEPYSFQEFLHTHQFPSFTRLTDLFDYIIANFQGRLYATGRARLLLETMERLSSTPDLKNLEVDIIKTIGLLNWLAEVSHLQATKDALFMSLRADEKSDELLTKTLDSLQTRSLIVYRRFNKTYSIWQGSDVDLEEQLQNARRKLTGAFSIAEAVQRFLPPRPFVARRHSYQKGTLRYFDVQYIDVFNRDQISLTASDGASGLIVLCLPNNPPEAQEFLQWAASNDFQDKPGVVVGVITGAIRLTELLYELRCLDWIRENTPGLRDDPVARKELRARNVTVELLVSNLLENVLSMHQLADSKGCQWFYNGLRLETSDQIGLSHLLSNVCDELFNQSPRLWNELINRSSLSSQGAAARRNLIEAMLTRPDQPILGITGFPPERSMYESILLASQLHTEIDSGTWAFQQLSDEDPLALKYVWQAMADFIFTDPPEPRSVELLFLLLKQPPYGLTDGVMPVLLCAFLIVNQAETTLYREGTLLPEPSIADWEVLLRRPELFQVAGCRVTGNLVLVVERLARGLDTEAEIMPVVRDLIRRLKTLPEHTWKTQELSEHARSLRRVVENARSPEQFLFQQIPEALEIQPLTSSELSSSTIEVFFRQLNQTLTELADNVDKLQMWARDHFLQASGFTGGETGWGEFMGMAAEMAPRVVNPNLSPLLKRAAEASNAQTALDSVLAVIANRPLHTWSDFDTERFAAQARFLGRLLQAERNGSAPTTALSPAERLRTEEIFKEIESLIHEQYAAAEWSQLQVALQLLAQQYQGRLTNEPL